MQHKLRTVLAVSRGSFAIDHFIYALCVYHILFLRDKLHAKTMTMRDRPAKAHSK